MIIAIDGTTASGKGTLGKRLSDMYALPYLDTGLLYRAVAAAVLADGGDVADVAACASRARALQAADLDNPGLRGSAVGAAASVVASHGEVRRVLLDLQRDFAQQPGGAVLDGRDIGTVIAPQAEFKFWVDADMAVRAGRRYRELVALGEDVTEAGVLAQLKERDLRDRTRKDAPAQAAADAAPIDTTAMTPDEVVATALAVIHARRPDLAGGRDGRK